MICVFLTLHINVDRFISLGLSIEVKARAFFTESCCNYPAENWLIELNIGKKPKTIFVHG